MNDPRRIRRGRVNVEREVLRGAAGCARSRVRLRSRNVMRTVGQRNGWLERPVAPLIHRGRANFLAVVHHVHDVARHALACDHRIVVVGRTMCRNGALDWANVVRHRANARRRRNAGVNLEREVTRRQARCARSRVRLRSRNVMRTVSQRNGRLERPVARRHHCGRANFSALVHYVHDVTRHALTSNHRIVVVGRTVDSDRSRDRANIVRHTTNSRYGNCAGIHVEGPIA
ncbi:hypothetical protein BSU04_26890 [Caballeronia sordidicola]|uniref:Uncharacterized protein n=1 Tax=Caballeronia sordidicola TaxID=196367 RepID=A0A226WW87_CABSO|nr:hypothetical protein BSU04_26890 [Caballeronia sordidicola]